ncbi:hypothetical protein QVD17_34656 [Tagetes erecta]|uniref:Protein kinase domain-containing protein n=1 Tax=Tagetes erecta TaxID=13708 RepID=A0AAD8K4K9_TARER|nr:hypothetical protein QVD17_34656 [Tagetes erecta]
MSISTSVSSYFPSFQIPSQSHLLRLQQHTLLSQPSFRQTTLCVFKISTSASHKSLQLLDPTTTSLFRGGIYSFDLEDLLRASAEVLGKGSVGTSYKAVLEEGTTVVVKRLKDVVVTKKECEAQMEILGKMKNKNVVASPSDVIIINKHSIIKLDTSPEETRI